MPHSIQKTFQFSLNYLKFLPLFEVMIVDIVMAEENKFSTLKNTISSGFGKRFVYIGKLITSLILTAFCDGIFCILSVQCVSSVAWERSDFGVYGRLSAAYFCCTAAYRRCHVCRYGIRRSVSKNAVYIFSFIGFISFRWYLKILA